MQVEFSQDDSFTNEVYKNFDYHYNDIWRYH